MLDGVNADSGGDRRLTQADIRFLRPDPERSRRVDVAPGAPTLSPDLALLHLQGWDFAELFRAQTRARALDVSGADVLVASGRLGAEEYLKRLGQRLNAPVVTTARIDTRVALDDALRQGWCRAQLPDGREVLLVSGQGPLLQVLMRTSARLRDGQVALIEISAFHALLARHFGARIALDAAGSVTPALSARTGATVWHRLAGALVLIVLGLWLVVDPVAAITYVPLALGLFFLAASLVQLSACIEGAPVAPRHVETDDARLPRYTVLAPLYREAAVVDSLIAGLDRIEYPREKLQVLLIVEEHDAETRAALSGRLLPPSFAVFVAPAGAPHTKPRAINAAMPMVTGELVVVYDAEDRPDPDQLRAAAAAFRVAPRQVVCLQARLAIDNTWDSILTRLFTIEYAALFDVVKAGNARLGLPVPLGGTSNHFRVAALRRIGLWDAWNVTEDADLGLRIALHGLLVDDLPSTTLEEAPNAFRPWLAQRTRWLKGWMQTIVVHSRAPLASWRAMGTVNFLSAVAMSAGIVVGALGAPVFYGLLALRLWAGEPLGAGGMTGQIADSVMLVLAFAGALSLLLPSIIGLMRRRLLRLAPWILLLPAYQLLVSLAAWRGLIELIRAPHRWNKTMHGKARTSRTAAVQKQAAQAAASNSTNTAVP